ncbi:MAG TPA: extracellular solute-binding protein [Ruminiclostridium sp.]|nr:extracellular solute-binding protein [Ruminiclostridium sp.]
MKSFVKKASALVLVAAMAAGMTACKGSTSKTSGAAGGKVTLTYWNIYTTEPQKTMVANIVKKWNDANPNIQIQATATENDAYKTKIKTAISANEAPDIIYSWTQGFMQPFVEANKLLPLDNYLSDVKDKMLSGALDTVTFNGKVYGLTYMQQAGALYVNKDLFTKYNVKIPTTFSELLTAVKTFRSNGLTPMALGEKDEWPGMWYYDMIALRTAGAKLSTDALTGKASFEDKAFSDAADKLLQLVNAGAFDPGVMGLTRDESNAQYTQGKIPMYFGGNFEAAQYDADTSAVKGKIEAVPFPIAEGGKGTSTEYIGGGSDCLLIPANTKNKDAAVKAAKYLAQNLSSQSFLLGAGLPEWKYDDVDVSKVDPLTQQIMKNIVTGSTASVPAWDIYLTGDKAQIHKDLVAKLYGKSITGTEFAKQMQSQVNGK